MLRKPFTTLSALSGLALLSCATMSCETTSGGPNVDVCVSDPGASGFQCHGKDNKPYFRPYEQSENWVAFSPDDLDHMITYYKTACKQGH